MKRCLGYILFSFLGIGFAWADVPLNTSCTNPVPVNADYSDRIPMAGDYWFTAWTYDLPLGGFFVSDDPANTTKPTAEIDFTCTKGQYDDPKLAEVIRLAQESGAQVPIPFTFERTARDGVEGYELKVGSSYRDMLAAYGITDNVQALICVHFPTSGSITMAPDSSFRDCMKEAHYVRFGDTLRVLTNDSASAYVLPYTDWQNDSVRFIWRGTQSLDIYVSGKSCDFYPDISNFEVWDRYTIVPDDTLKLTMEDIRQAMKSENSNGGIFFSKMLTQGVGRLIVEQVPQKPAEGGAVLLRYDVPTMLQANDTNALFYIPKTWVKGTRFLAATPNLFSMYVSSSAFFSLSEADAHVIGEYRYSPVAAGHEWCFSDAEMEALWQSATSDYLYIRFVCKAATSVTPSLFQPSDCMNKSSVIISGKPFRVAANNSLATYRLRYADWQNYDMRIAWKGTAPLPVYIVDDCECNLSSANPSVLRYESVPKKDSITIEAARINGWKERAEALGGYLYVRFYNRNRANTVTFTFAKPEEEEPVITTQAATIALHCMDNGVIVVTVSQEQELVLVDEQGNTIEQWHQQVGDGHTLTLPSAAQYILKGQKEQIIVSNQ